MTSSGKRAPLSEIVVMLSHQAASSADPGSGPKSREVRDIAWPSAQLAPFPLPSSRSAIPVLPSVCPLHKLMIRLTSLLFEQRFSSENCFLPGVGGVQESSEVGKAHKQQKGVKTLNPWATSDPERPALKRCTNDRFINHPDSVHWLPEAKNLVVLDDGD